MFFWEEDLLNWFLGISLVKRFCSWMVKNPKRKLLCARFVRSDLMNPLGPTGGKMGNWYTHNDIYKYQIGQRIWIRERRIFGHGVNARGIVSAYTTNQWGENAYEVIMDHETNVDWFEWVKSGELPDSAVTVTDKQLHFKWNIEHHFVLDNHEVSRGADPIGFAIQDSVKKSA